MIKLFGNLNNFLFSNMYVTGEPVELYIIIYVIVLLLTYIFFIKLCNNHINNSNDFIRCGPKIIPSNDYQENKCQIRTV